MRRRRCRICGVLFWPGPDSVGERKELCGCCVDQPALFELGGGR